MNGLFNVFSFRIMVTTSQLIADPRRETGRRERPTSTFSFMTSDLDSDSEADSEADSE